MPVWEPMLGLLGTTPNPNRVEHDQGGERVKVVTCRLCIVWTARTCNDSAMPLVNGPCKSQGSIILWIWKEEPSGGGVDGSRRLGGREGGDGERG